MDEMSAKDPQVAEAEFYHGISKEFENATGSPIKAIPEEVYFEGWSQSPDGTHNLWIFEVRLPFSGEKGTAHIDLKKRKIEISLNKEYPSPSHFTHTIPVRTAKSFNKAVCKAIGIMETHIGIGCRIARELKKSIDLVRDINGQEKLKMDIFDNQILTPNGYVSVEDIVVSNNDIHRIQIYVGCNDVDLNMIHHECTLPYSKESLFQATMYAARAVNNIHSKCEACNGPR